jgi:hypothetical protein
MYKTAVFMFCAGEDEQRLSAFEESTEDRPGKVAGGGKN